MQLGRLLRTAFLADYFVKDAFRNELRRVLNRGEAVNALKRAIYTGRISPAQEAAALQNAGVPTLANAQLNGLSGGQLQRVLLARALLDSPDILILDEPTSGVDPVARDGFWELLVELSREHGVTIFISTHFMNEAMRCDCISLMHAGRVLAVGETEELVEGKGAGTLEEGMSA